MSRRAMDGGLVDPSRLPADFRYSPHVSALGGDHDGQSRHRPLATTVERDYRRAGVAAAGPGGGKCGADSAASSASPNVYPRLSGSSSTKSRRATARPLILNTRCRPSSLTDSLHCRQKPWCRPPGAHPAALRDDLGDTRCHWLDDPDPEVARRTPQRPPRRS